MVFKAIKRALKHIKNMGKKDVTEAEWNRLSGLIKDNDEIVLDNLVFDTKEARDIIERDYKFGILGQRGKLRLRLKEILPNRNAQVYLSVKFEAPGDLIVTKPQEKLWFEETEFKSERVQPYKRPGDDSDKYAISTSTEIAGQSLLRTYLH